MTTQLRPLSLGEILDRTAELYRSNFLLFAGVAAIFASLMLLVAMMQTGFLAALGYPNVAPNLGWAIAVTGVVVYLLVALMAGLSIAAMSRAVAWVHLGQPATIRAAASSILPRLRRYLWLTTSILARAWGTLALLYVIMMAIFFAAFPPGWITNPALAQRAPLEHPEHFLVASLSMLALAPLFALAFAFGVVMWLRYSIAIPACVVEGLSTRDALKRGIELSKGARGRMLVLWLLVFAIRFGLAGLLGLPMFIYAMKHMGQPLPLAMAALAQVGGFVVNTFIGPIYSTGLTLFYYDQRVRKEGFDIDWMMQAAGLSPQPELPGPENQSAAPETESPQI
jgi:hypothetical protein